MPFNVLSLIRKKRGGEELSREELDFLLSGFTKGEVPDYQMSAFLMAVYFQGMTAIETAHFVELMKNSGTVLHFERIKNPKVDKHSTGGIGDKTTLILGPLLACFDVAYPSIAGRGLAHTGGTIDKLEAIPGFQCEIPIKRFGELLSSAGFAVMGQTSEICPTDKKLYALRDVTGTVESIPLIVASIMSKKLAEGIDGIVLDVKTGSGAFMKSESDAKALGKALLATAKQAGKLARVLVTDMSEPLGRAAGHSIEVNECVAFLRQGPQDAKPDVRLYELTLALAEELLVMAEKQRGKKLKPKDARKALEEALQSGKAYAKFLEVISLQGGDTEAVDTGLPLAPKQIHLLAKQSGYVQPMNAEAIGMALVELGGGRKKTTDTIDFSVGFEFHCHVGDKVKKDQPLVTLFARDQKMAEQAKAALEQAIQIHTKAPRKAKLIRCRL